MGHNAKNICTTVISGKEQDLNKQMAGFENIHTFSKLDLYFSQIQYFFKDLKTDFTIEYFSKLSIPRGNPAYWYAHEMKMAPSSPTQFQRYDLSNRNCLKEFHDIRVSPSQHQGVVHSHYDITCNPTTSNKSVIAL